MLFLFSRLIIKVLYDCRKLLEAVSQAMMKPNIVKGLKYIYVKSVVDVSPNGTDEPIRAFDKLLLPRVSSW